MLPNVGVEASIPIPKNPSPASVNIPFAKLITKFINIYFFH